MEPQTPITHQQAADVRASQADPPTTPVVITEEDGDLIAAWTSASPLAASNLDITGPAGLAMVTQAMCTSDLRTRSAVGHILDVVGYVAHVAELTSKETGEVTKKLRAVLMLADGRTLSTMSTACIRALRLIAQTMGEGKWDPPIQVEVREHPLEEGKSYCDMRVIVQGAKPQAKAKK